MRYVPFFVNKHIGVVLLDHRVAIMEAISAAAIVSVGDNNSALEVEEAHLVVHPERCQPFAEVLDALVGTDKQVPLVISNPFVDGAILIIVAETQHAMLHVNAKTAVELKRYDDPAGRIHCSVLPVFVHA